jgi:hypothetical protein
MTPTLRKRLLIGAAGLVGLLIVALLAAPSLIDLNARKAEVIAAVKKATGRALILDGPVSLKLLPVPTATVRGVKFFNVAGAKNRTWWRWLIPCGFPASPVRRRYRPSEVTLVDPRSFSSQRRGQTTGNLPPPVADQARAPRPATPAGAARSVAIEASPIFSDSGRSLRRRREGA